MSNIITNFIHKIFKPTPRHLSYAEDKRQAKILREAPYSEEGKAIRRDIWKHQSYLARFLSLKDIELFKYMYDLTNIQLGEFYATLKQQQKEDFIVYCLNPEYYNKKYDRFS